MSAAYLVAGSAVVAGAVALDRMATRVVRPVPRPPVRSVPDLGLEHEDVRIPSGRHDLGAWVLRGSGSSCAGPLVVLAHGWGASYGTMLRLGEPLVRAGHDVLLFDVRGHGRNEPAPFVTVRHFRDDVTAVARWAAKRFPDRPLVLVGHSMGGAAGVLAVAEGAPIHGLALVAAPADVVRVTAEFLVGRGMPGNLMVHLFRPFWWRRVGGSFLPLTPSRRIGEVRVPLLLIQPENDQRVHRRHVERLAAAAGIGYHLVAGREHTDVLEAPETISLVRALLEQVTLERAAGTA